MKNFFALIFILLLTGLTAHTQSLTLADSTGPLSNNANVYKRGYPSGETSSYFFVHNGSSHSMDVGLKKVIFDTVTFTTNTICWGGLCYPPFIYVSPNTETIVPGQTDSSGFAGHYDANGHQGDSRIRYVFYDASNTNDTVCVNVTYAAYDVGIQTLSANNVLSNAYPNPASSSVNFDYSVVSGSAASIIIRNVLGLIVKDAPLKNVAGKLSVNALDLPDGVYFYSLNVDGKVVVTRKLIVKH